jgi:hypothetical protein
MAAVVAPADDSPWKYGSYEDDIVAIVKMLNTGHRDAKEAMCLQASGVSQSEAWRLKVRDFSKGKKHLDGIYMTAKNRGLFIIKLRKEGMEMTESMFG